jgi:hypothetical protein
MENLYQPAAFVIHSHDRSISYEYKRTYMCHRKLYELFGLSTVPTIKHVALSTYRSVRQDLSHILAHERHPREILRWLVKIPLLSFSSVYGQYRGAKDERLRRGRKQLGV